MSPTRTPFRIGIVNDLAMAREALRRVVLQVPDVQVAWTANDGLEAVQRARADRPDLILMDLIMPVMDGVEATRTIMREAPCPIVVVTATVEGNASRVYDAIGAGALDAVDTPRLGASGTQGEVPLVEKIRAVRRMGAEERASQSAAAGSPASAAPGAGAPHATAMPGPRQPEPAAPTGAVGASAAVPCAIVGVGSSTGGPQALSTLIAALPDPMPFAVLIVQHMDAMFLPGLANWLRSHTGREVHLARRGDRPVAGSILVAGEAMQMVITAEGAVDYVAGDPNLIHRPSVDVFFDSLARSRTLRGAAVLLTGMGRDGAAGMLAMRGRGWRTFAQDRQTSVVWGMPGAASEIGAAEQVLPLQEIGPAVAVALRAPAGGAR